MTHFFSCMSTILKRNSRKFAGTIEYGYYQDGIYVEIIADGHHVPQNLLRMIAKIKGVEKVVLVTDSMRAAGMPEGPSILGGLESGQPVIVEEGVAKLQDRSAFAGSVATADLLVRTMVQLADCSMGNAVRMLTENPARVMGIADRKGSLKAGLDADVIIFDENVNIKKTIIEGKIIYEN